MTSLSRIALLASKTPYRMLHRLERSYSVDVFNDPQSCQAALEEANLDYKLLVVDFVSDQELALKACEAVGRNEDDLLPVIVYSSESSLPLKLKAFDAGCDEFIDDQMNDAELDARLMKSIYNRIANEQLKSQMQQANEMAMVAMTSSSDIGIGVQFILASHDCNNADELGQLFFQTVKYYDACCSIQLRSKYGEKNMEANGLAKSLESQLLTQLSDRGRFFDFGCRTIINYEQVSILVKNMPLDDEKRYGMFKDAFPVLAQGMDARLKAIDAQQDLKLEKALLERLTLKIQSTLLGIEQSFQQTVKDIATVADDLSESLLKEIPCLGLTEEQENVFEKIIETNIEQTEQVFSKGLNYDSNLLSLLDKLQSVIGGDDAELNPLQLKQVLDSI